MDQTKERAVEQHLQSQAIQISGLQLQVRILTETIKAMTANRADLAWLEARVAEARAKLTT